MVIIIKSTRWSTNLSPGYSYFFFRDHLRSTLGITCSRGSFAVHFRDHLRSRDHLRYCTVPLKPPLVVSHGSWVFAFAVPALLLSISGTYHFPLVNIQLLPTTPPFDFSLKLTNFGFKRLFCSSQPRVENCNLGNLKPLVRIVCFLFWWFHFSFTEIML